MSRRRRPDAKNASSILDAAERRMRFTRSLEVSEESAATIAANIYECFRMLGDALFVQLGIMDAEHKEMIDELMALDVETRRPVAAVRNLRQLRHNINYYGYEPTVSEVRDLLDLADACFGPLAMAVRQKLRTA